MESTTVRRSTRIARRAGEQGARPSTSNQVEVEKSATGRNSSKPRDGDPSLNETKSQGGGTPTPRPNNTKSKRCKWSEEEYKGVMRAYYEAKHHPKGQCCTKEAYNIWRSANQNTREGIDANKLANVRRYIVNQKILNDEQLQEIEDEVKVKDVNNNAIEQTLPEPVYAEEVEVPFLENEINADPELNNGIHEEDIDENVIQEIKTKWEEVKHLKLEERPRLLKIRTSNKNKEVLRKVNSAVKEIQRRAVQPLDITQINELIYSAATIAQDQCGLKTKHQKDRRRKQPAWKARIQKIIDQKRADLSTLTEMKRGGNVNQKKRNTLVKIYKIKSHEDYDIARERLKQEIQAKAQRIRRYEKRSRFYRQNLIFKEDAKKFYRELGKTQIEVKEHPKKEEIEEFWRNIMEKDKKHNTQAEWIKHQEEVNEDKNTQTWDPISTDEVKMALKNASNWKSPGVDGVTNYWLKMFGNLHQSLADAYNHIINTPEEAPQWLTQGTTYLLPKTEKTKLPKNYRPITCLPTMYKILTSIITERTYNFLENEDMLPTEQKGCKRGSYGCKDQLLVNKMIIEDCKKRLRKLSEGWVDYRKAFDSVPHSWILECMRIFKLSPTLIKFFENSMSKWQTIMSLQTEKSTITTSPIKIRSGIFQGDSFSPLIFCLALAPLSLMLNDSKLGYEIKNQKINHLFYMDDLKLYAGNDEELEKLLKIVKEFSDDIGMEFGLDKCAKATFIRGRLTKSQNIQLDRKTEIKDLEQEETYKYLGVDESNGIQHPKMREKIRKEYYRRVRLVLKSELNSANKMTAINTLAVPVVTYSFNIIQWPQLEIKNLDRKTRKLLTTYRMYHPKSDVERLYVPRREGGRGLMQIENAYKAATIGLEVYLREKNDRFLKLVYQHEADKKLYSVVKEAERIRKEMKPIVEQHRDNEQTTKLVKRVKAQVRNNLCQQLQETWKSKVMHGQFPKSLEKADVNKEQSYNWLRSSGLKPETEGLIIAAQDQSLATRYYRNRIIKDGTDPRCRMCNKYDETIEHITSGCPILAPTEYLHRHNRVAAYVHQNILKAYNIQSESNWYDHQPKTVTENEEVTILWDMPITTDKQINANRPDIVVKDHKKKICYLLDISTPSDRNIANKEIEKLSKYKDLEIEINRMWNMETIVIPVIIGNLGVIRKTCEKWISKIPGKINIDMLQKITLLGTAHILRKFLSIKTV